MMNTQEHTAVQLLPIIEERYSPRTFSETSIPDETLRIIIEAAQSAPSSFNEQPWNFVVARKQDDLHYSKMLTVLYEKNREWAQEAPVLMLSVASSTHARNGKANKFAWHDLGLAMGNLMIQASALNISIHQMGGFDTELAKDLFHIPEGFDPVAMTALGYRKEGDEAGLRNRKALKEIAFNGNWNNPLFAE
jgi:nitroreductase